MPTNPSTSDIMNVVLGVLSFALVSFGVFCLWKNQAFLQRIFSQTPENVSAADGSMLIAWFICWIWWVSADIYDYKKHTFLTEPPIVAVFEVAAMVTSRHLVQVQYISSIIYLQAEVVVEARLKLLNARIFMWTEQQIVSHKTTVRYLIAELNRTFSTLLAIMYSKIFSLLYVRSILFIRQPLLKPEHAFLIVGPVLYVANMYVMSCRASHIADICEQTEFRLRTKRLTSLSSFIARVRVERVLIATRTQDSLVICDCFIHSKATFLAYLGLLVTCVAILIQFDYRVMAMLDSYKVRYLSGNFNHEVL